MEERKSNKKTRIVIIASMLLLLIAIACLCGTTFARYITKKDVPSTQATVAKWGFVVNAETKDLFAKDYTLKDGATVAEKAADGTGVAVKSDGNVVAPGTTGSMTFGVTGTAEVLAEVSVSLVENSYKDVKLYTSGKETTPEHAPVMWTLQKKNTTEGDANNGKFEDVTGAVDVKLDVALSKIAAVKIDAGATADIEYKLIWSWPIEKTTGTPDEKSAWDALDTLLGRAAQGPAAADKPYPEATVTAVTENQKYTVVTTAETPVTYTADIVLDFTLTVAVKQIQE